MTVSADEAFFSGPYLGNGATVQFDFDFKIYAPGELRVTRRETDDSFTLLTETVDYTVAGVGDNSGYITLTSGSLLPTGTSLTIEPDITPSQDRPYGSQTSIDFVGLGLSFDKLTSLFRQALGKLDRAIVVPPGTAGGNLLPGDPDRVVVFDADGNLKAGPDAADIEGAQAAADAAIAASATAVLASSKVYGFRTTANAAALYAALAEGEIGWMGGLAYRKVTAAGGVSSATYDLGQDGLVPAEITYWTPEHFGAVGDGVADDAPAWSRLAAARPSTGVGIVMLGDYRFGSTVQFSLNAGGALGWGVSITAAGKAMCDIIHDLGTDDPALYFRGPSGTFASGLRLAGFRVSGAVAREGVGVRLAGISNCAVDIDTRNLKRGLQCEAVLRSEIKVADQNSVVQVEYLDYGTLGGDWAETGCNENSTYVNLSQGAQYAVVYENCRPGRLFGHVERAGNENVAGGGVVDTNRGGIWLKDPIGSMEIVMSSEDCGDREDGQDGFGMLRVQTTGLHDEPWEVVMSGVSIHGTLDRPTAYINVFQHAASGYGRIVMNGGAFSDHPTYAGNAANSYLSLQADGRNLGVHLNSVSMKYGMTEFADKLNPDVDYYLTGMPESTPSGAHTFVKTAEPNQPLMKLVSGGDFAGTGEAIFASGVQANNGAVFRHTFNGANSAGDEISYVQLLATLLDNTPGSELGKGLSVNTRNAAGAMETDWKFGRTGIASFGEAEMGRETINIGGSYYVSGTKVVGSRETGWTAGAGTPLKGTFDAATANLNEACRRIIALEQALRAHGLIN